MIETMEFSLLHSESNSSMVAEHSCDPEDSALVATSIFNSFMVSGHFDSEDEHEYGSFAIMRRPFMSNGTTDSVFTDND